ncbi:MAG: hypothetical protein GY862_07900, partial [Gammaproteobacteria bacterium]|nr:hypothetical protein [Gammaproteobacteria bacterium]
MSHTIYYPNQSVKKEYPGLQAIVFDQEHVVENARKVLESAGLAERSQVIGGNFFESMQTG